MANFDTRIARAGTNAQHLPPLPTFSWEMAEAVLQEMVCGSPAKMIFVHDYLQAARKQAMFLPDEEVMRMILGLAMTVGSEDFRP